MEILLKLRACWLRCREMYGELERQMLETKSKTGETEKCRARPTSHSGYLCVVCREMGSMSTSPALDYKQTCFWLNMLWLVEWLLITNECQVRKTQKDQITCLHCLSEGAFIPITNWLNSFMAWWYEISGALGVIKIIIHIIYAFSCFTIVQ